MKVTMRVEFDREEVHDICRAEYIRLFGQPPKGFNLCASGNYGTVTVVTICDPAVAPQPAGAVTDEPPVYVIELPADEPATEAPYVP